jgi:hypothetical protein
MNNWIEGPAPRRKNRGCFPTGCFFFVGLFALLAVAFFAGGLFGMRYVIVATKMSDLPQSLLSPAEQQSVEQRWEDFERRARNGEGTTAEFTTGEWDHVLAMQHRTARLAIATNSGRVRFDIPLGRIGFAGHHLQLGAFLDDLSANTRVTQLKIDGNRVIVQVNGGEVAAPAPIPQFTPSPTAVPAETSSPNADALTTASPVRR